MKGYVDYSSAKWYKSIVPKVLAGFLNFIFIRLCVIYFARLKFRHNRLLSYVLYVGLNYAPNCSLDVTSDIDHFYHYVSIVSIFLLLELNYFNFSKK